MDVRDMSFFPDDSFDTVIDKGNVCAYMQIKTLNPPPLAKFFPPYLIMGFHFYVQCRNSWFFDGKDIFIIFCKAGRKFIWLNVAFFLILFCVFADEVRHWCSNKCFPNAWWSQQVLNLKSFDQSFSAIWLKNLVSKTFFSSFPNFRWLEGDLVG